MPNLNIIPVTAGKSCTVISTSVQPYNLFQKSISNRKFLRTLTTSVSCNLTFRGLQAIRVLKGKAPKLRYHQWQSL